MNLTSQLGVCKYHVNLQLLTVGEEPEVLKDRIDAMEYAKEKAEE